MAFGNSGGQHRLMSEINVTPMVDVMLVLLVIFMVTAPMLMHGVDVDVPKATATPIEMKKEHLVVAIDSKRRVFIGKRQVTLPQLGAVLSARRDTRVFLRADQGVPYGVVVRVMAAISRAGVKKLGMVTDPTVEPGSGGKRPIR